MNRDILAGKWKQFRGSVKERWGKLTDDELDRIDGKADRLVGALQEKYGHSREQAEKELDAFLASAGKTQKSSGAGSH